MLADKEAMATIAVRNLDTSKKFYKDILGFEPAGTEGPGVATFNSGNSTILVYESEYAGTNQATAATWGVGDELEQIIAALKKAGVKFEHYDMPDTRLEGDIHYFGDFKAAWFKDPDGNILHINSG
jgi:catechol 2,3-dioxygenase-like lactoylglutathione lyase family enzyme